MSSYRPVIIVFFAIGVLAAIGIGYGTVRLAMYSLTTLSSNTDLSNRDFNSFGDTSSTDSPFMFTTSTSENGTDAVGGYLGSDVGYDSLKDPKVQETLKIPDATPVDLADFLKNPFTKLSAVYQSSSTLVLAVKNELDTARQPYIKQDLATGVITELPINSQVNSALHGSEIVFVTTNPDTASQYPDSLNQLVSLNVETGERKVIKLLTADETFTKDTPSTDGTGPVSDLATKNGVVQVDFYQYSTANGFGAEPKLSGTISYPTSTR